MKKIVGYVALGVATCERILSKRSSVLSFVNTSVMHHSGVSRLLSFALLLLLSLYAPAHVAAETFTLTFMNGGEVYAQIDVERGTGGTLATLLNDNGYVEPTTYDDYEFCGWSYATTVTATTTTPISLRTSVASVNGNLTYYATYRKGTTGSFTQITQTSQITEGDYVLVYNSKLTASDGTYYFGAVTSESYTTTDGNNYETFAIKSVATGSTIPSTLDVVPNNAIWTLEGSTGNWKLKAYGTSNYLYVQDVNQPELSDVNSTTFSINSNVTSTYMNNNFVRNGATSNYALAYAGSAKNPYYIKFAGTSTDAFKSWRMFKGTSTYTYTTEEAVEMVELNFVVDGTTYTRYVNKGTEITLSDFDVLATAVSCGDWTFYNWTDDTPTTGDQTTAYTAITTYTATANKTFYAQYKKTVSETTSWAQISNPNDIVDGGHYLITRYSDDYVAKTTNKRLITTYYSGYITTSITASGTSPNKTIAVSSVTDDMIWTFYKDGSGWQIVGETEYTKADADSSMYMYYSSSTYHKLENRAPAHHVFTVTGLTTNSVYNGNLRFKSSYVASGTTYEGYFFFITLSSKYYLTVCATSGTSYSYVHLYKEVTNSNDYYNCYPRCTAHSITLNAVSGLVEGETEIVKTEESAKAGIILPAATTECSPMGWELAGWKLGSIVSSTIYTGDLADVLPAGTVVYPTDDNDNYYAVYRRKTGEMRFSQITSLSDLEDGGKYLIMDSNKNLAKKEDYVNSNTSADLKSGIKTDSNPYSISAWTDIITDPADKYVWELNIKTSITTNYKYGWRDAETDSYMYGQYGWSSGTKRNLVYSTDYATRFEPFVNAKGVFAFHNEWTESSTTYVRDLAFQTYLSTTYLTAGYNSSKQYNLYIFKGKYTYTYSSNVECSTHTITYHAGSGTVDGERDKTYEESAIYEGFVLPTAIADCSATGWQFAGWAESSVSETETKPTLLYAGTTVYPETDVEYYAVYYKISDEIFRQITSTNSLEDNGRYLIIHNMKQSTTCIPNNVGGYEMFMAAGKTVQNNTILVEGIALASEFSFGNPIYNPSESVVWTLKKDGEGWRWQDATTGKYMQIDGSKLLISDSPTTFTITVNSGEYTMVNGRTLRFANATPYNLFAYSSSGTNYLPHLYKSSYNAKYNSNPNCNTATIHLHGCAGTVTEDEVLGTVGAPLTLPAAVFGECATGDVWEFAGWREGDTLSYIMTNVLPDGKELIPAGTYTPTKEVTELYAVYKKTLLNFWTTQKMVDGEEYVLGDYVRANDDDFSSDVYYQMVASSDVPSSGLLSGVNKRLFRQNNNSNRTQIRIEDTDTKLLWVLNKYIVNTVEVYTLRNKETGKYMQLNGSSGSTGTISLVNNPEDAYMVIFNNEGTDNEVFLYRRGDYPAYFHANTESGTYKNKTFKTYTTKGDNSHHYMKLRVKEFASYPPCDGYKVYFDPEEGEIDVAANAPASLSEDPAYLTEAAAYKGVTVPNAHVNVGCQSERWEVAGWAENIIDEVTGEASFSLFKPGLLKAGDTYYPEQDGATLHAVYGVIEDTWKRLENTKTVKLGGEYVIAYCPQGETRKALLSGEPDHIKTGTYTDTYYKATDGADLSATKTITYIEGDWRADTGDEDESTIIAPEDQYIWRLIGTRDQYYLQNKKTGKYLSIKDEYVATLTDDRVDSLSILYFDGDKRSGAAISSNVNLARQKRYLVRNVTTDDKVQFYTNGVQVAKGTKDLDVSNRDRIYLFRQEGVYFSEPLCNAEANVVEWKEDGLVVESYDLTGAPAIDGSTLNDDGTYTIPYDVAGNPCARLKFEWDNAEVKLDVPMYVKASETMSEMIGAKSAYVCNACDVVVQDGGALEVDVNTRVRTITLYPGATLTIPAGKTLNAKTIILHAEGDNAATMPRINVIGDINLTENAIYHDRRIDEDRYYWFTLPFNASLNDIKYANMVFNEENKAEQQTATYRTDYWLKWYDGAARAAYSNAGGTVTTRTNFWQHIAAAGENATITAGKGYILGINDQYTATGHKYRTLRFPMTVTDWTAEQDREKAVAVTASTVADPKKQNNAGWNIIGNPYLGAYTPTAATGLALGELVITTDGDGKQYYTVNTEGDKNVPYMTLYDAATNTYSSVRIAGHEQSPLSAYFVQVKEGTGIDFSSASMNAHAAPAYRRAAQAANETVNVDIFLAAAQEGTLLNDHFSLVINDDYTEQYEIGADLAKMIGAGNAAYTLNADNLQLAFNALSGTLAERAIPVGIVITQAGYYTFSLSSDTEQSFTDYDDLQHVYLTDYDEGMTVDLLYEDYEFYSKKQTNNTRFVLTVERKKTTQVTTDVEDNLIDNPSIYVYSNNLQINIVGLTAGERYWVYSATGQLIQTATATQGINRLYVPATGVYTIRSNQQMLQTIVK